MTPRTWMLILLVGLFSVPFAYSSETGESEAVQKNAAAVPLSPTASEVHFTPPDEAAIPDNEYGEVVRYGKSLFFDTQQLNPEYVGNGMNCRNCHLNNGRQADSSPLWAAFGMYPAFRKKNNHVNTYEERLQGCFTYSMNGTPPASGSKELTALITYSYWLSAGVPLGKEMVGRGYPELAKPVLAPDVERGQQVYTDSCAICHGDNGQGMKSGAAYVYPPLWGNDSFNWGAGMHRVNTSADFIKSNMPFGTPNTLSDQEAWDVAAFMNQHERPQDPRFNGDLAQTQKEFHDHQCFYGD